MALSELKTKMKKKYAVGIAVGASVVALTGAVWGATLLTGSGHDSAARGGEAGNQGSVREGSERPEVTVPQTIAHAAESGGQAVNITIDDGPDPKWTPRILRVLKENQVKAVFCMIGPQARQYPDLVKQVVAEGHRLCDHTMSHNTSMDKKPVAYQQQEILAARKMIEDAAGGAKVEYYRAPGGAFTPDSRRIAAGAGMRPLGWNVDTKDFEKPGTGVIVNNVHRELTNGPTILFHDGGGDRHQTVAAMEQVLPWLKEQGHPTSFPVRTQP